MPVDGWGRARMRCIDVVSMGVWPNPRMDAVPARARRSGRSPATRFRSLPFVPVPWALARRNSELPPFRAVRHAATLSGIQRLRPSRGAPPSHSMKRRLASGRSPLGAVGVPLQSCSTLPILYKCAKPGTPNWFRGRPRVPGFARTAMEGRISGGSPRPLRGLGPALSLSPYVMTITRMMAGRAHGHHAYARGGPVKVAFGLSSAHWSMSVLVFIVFCRHGATRR